MNGETITGSIMPWPLDFEPNGWMFCRGQLLEISKYMPLFNLIGTTYGGDGRQYFALPDLRGRIPVGAGENLGTKESVQLAAFHDTSSLFTMQTANLPPHDHKVSIDAKMTNAAGQTVPDTVTADYKIPASSKNRTTPPDVSTTPYPASYLGHSAANLYTTSDADFEVVGGEANIHVPPPIVKISGEIVRTGGGIPVDTTPPYLALNYIIAIMGIYPTK
ncbi:MAG: tail fiber protein [Magnetococcales bacterium]|nr:tail fiber protein [Magnetococcales bacterium]